MVNRSETAREFKRDRKTVRKYIIQDDWNITVTNREPKKACPKLDPYKADIDQWLDDDKKAKRKQRHTARRVYDRFREKYK